MFGLFKGTKDFIYLGNTFCLVNRALTELIPKVYLASDKSEHNEAVMTLAYACKAGINNRLDKYGWTLHSGISVPSMSNKNVTILEAIHKTVGVLRDLAVNMNLEYEVEQILEGGSCSKCSIELVQRFLKIKSGFKALLNCTFCNGYYS